MRVDKYLWAIRMYKTRSQATHACKNGKVRVNNEIAKPSKDVFAGDAIGVRKNQINYSLDVLDLPSSRVGAKLVDMYKKDTTPKEEAEKKQLLSLSQDYYRKKGLGRPTKKDRRDLDDYISDTDD